MLNFNFYEQIGPLSLYDSHSYAMGPVVGYLGLRSAACSFGKRIYRSGTRTMSIPQNQES